ncbi:hypothetical protein ACEQ8H_002821 [Pleosporales sp. CAS-2024a]
MSKSPSLTLVVAATPSLGIGQGGTLPWPPLKKEMGYFARVTKRVVRPRGSPTVPVINAVLMGRKTWESIPPQFRPLPDRLNIVITRQARDEFVKRIVDAPATTTANKSRVEREGPLVASGILDALRQLEERREGVVQRIYVIGGASVYQTALELPQTKHVLLTKIGNEYDCDTFFPINLDESAVWTKAHRREWSEFTGEEGNDDVVEEQGVEFEYCLYTREDGEDE